MTILLLGFRWHPCHPVPPSSTSSSPPSSHAFFVDHLLVSVPVVPPCWFQIASPCGFSQSFDDRMGLMKVFSWLGRESEKPQTTYRRVFHEGLPSPSPSSNSIVIAHSVYNSLNISIRTREYIFFLHVHAKMYFTFSSKQQI